MGVTSGIDVFAMRAASGCLLAGIVVALAIVDLNRMILPDRLNLLLAGTGIGQSLTLGRPDLIDAGIGALMGAGILTLVAILFRRVRGVDGLGFGDQKFVAAAGIWIGWYGVPLMLLIASASALGFVAVRAASEGRLDKTARLPFGPFLGLGTVVAWLAMVNS